MSKAESKRTLVIVRHADALARRRWFGDDVLRPLSKKGERQAQALADQLATKDKTIMVSSHFLRCVQTLEPLAKRCRSRIEHVAYLAEEADPKLALDSLIARAYGKNGPFTVISCSHGDVLLGIASMFDGAGLVLPGVGPGIEKGARLELDCQDATVVATRYVPAP